MLCKKKLSAVLSAVLVLGVIAPVGGVLNISDNSLKASATAYVVNDRLWPGRAYGDGFHKCSGSLAYEEESGSITIYGVVTKVNDVVQSSITKWAPKEINGLPVTKIAPGAYGGLRKAVVGDAYMMAFVSEADLEVIGERAFSNSTELEMVTFRRGVKRIEDYAFEYTALKELTIPANNEYLGNYLFRACSKFTKITILSTDCEIADGFAYNSDYDLKYLYPNRFTIRGYMNSTAHEYALKHGMNFEPIDPDTPYITTTRGKERQSN